MLKKVFLSGLAIVLVFFAFNANAENKDDLKDAPAWVFDPQKAAGPGEEAAIGVAKIGVEGVETAKKKAFVRAVEELSAIRDVHIDQLIKEYSSDTKTEAGVSGEWDKTSMQKLKILAERTKRFFRGAKEKDFWTSPGGDVYVIAIFKEDELLLEKFKDNAIWFGYLKIYNSMDSSPGKSKDDHLFDMNEGVGWVNYVEESTAYDHSMKRDEKKTYPDAPEWVKAGSGASGKRLFAVGMAKSDKAGVGIAVIEARALARSELAMAIEIMKNRGTYKLVGDNAPESGKKEDNPIAVKSVSNSVISESRQKNIWVSPEGEVFVLVEMQLKD